MLNQQPMWQTIIDEILQIQGYHTTRLAREIGVNEATIIRLHSGQTHQPKYLTGARLLSLFLSLQYRN